ncbi:hypothetical protein ABK040_006454 [Willaertia magna]
MQNPDLEPSNGEAGLSEVTTTEDENNDELEEYTLEDDMKLTRYIQNEAIKNIELKRERYREYQLDRKEKMITFLTAILKDPLTPIFNQLVQKYVTPISFSIFEGIQADKVKNAMFSKEELERLRVQWLEDPKNQSIFNDDNLEN